MSRENSASVSVDVLKSTDDGQPVSRWWLAGLGLVLLYGFAALLAITWQAYDEKPPIPESVVDGSGTVLFRDADILRGQQIFLERGLMSNGTVWGHGSYLGPDFPAQVLHMVGERARDELALDHYGRPFRQLARDEADAIAVQVPEILRINRHDAKSGILTFTPAETAVLETSPAYWKDYFANPARNGGLPAGLVSDSAELKALSAYFSWLAWASVAQRPGHDYSYTNNFPYDPLVGNTPIVPAYVWSVASLIFLVGGIGLVLFIMGRHPQWTWHAAATPIAPMFDKCMRSPSQRALIKFVVVVAFLLLIQTLVGGGVAHYAADPSGFYGLDLSSIFPSSLLRTWHLQIMIFWVASGFVTGGLFLSRVLGAREMDKEKNLTNLLFTAFVAVIGGSLLCDWGGLAGLWPGESFWLGSQGWEYLEIGRLWQILLIGGLLAWFALISYNAWPALKKPASRKIGIAFLLTALAIPLFYLPAVFFNGQTHYTIVDIWRFWIIHLWVEGFFELFATSMVALIFIEMGLVARTTGLRLILLDGILILMGGIIGTGHHWYFSGIGTFNMTLASCFSALELVPLVLLCMEAARFIRTSENPQTGSITTKFRWPLRFILAVGFWNFLGAGVLGFLINMPIVSYFEVGTYLTPNHGHAAMFGVFGMLALGLCCLVLRQANSDDSWKAVEKYIAISFWGFNIGLALMLVLSLLPQGFLQLADALQHGYWHARSAEFTRNPLMSFIGWLRIVGDTIFILFGALPFLVASCKTWRLMRRNPAAGCDAAARS